MQMFNNRLRCEDLTPKMETEDQFDLPSDKKFKTVKIVNSAEDDLLAGEEVVIPITAGETDPYDENIVIIHRSEVIYKI